MSHGHWKASNPGFAVQLLRVLGFSLHSCHSRGSCEQQKSTKMVLQTSLHRNISDYLSLSKALELCSNSWVNNVNRIIAINFMP